MHIQLRFWKHVVNMASRTLSISWYVLADLAVGMTKQRIMYRLEI